MWRLDDLPEMTIDACDTITTLCTLSTRVGRHRDDADWF
jgi:hypothetical protein